MAELGGGSWPGLALLLAALVAAGGWVYQLLAGRRKAGQRDELRDELREQVQRTGAAERQVLEAEHQAAEVQDHAELEQVRNGSSWRARAAGVLERARGRRTRASPGGS